MTLATRLTGPLAALDGPLLAITDWGNDATPWVWWPLETPRRARPISPAHHAVIAAWTVGGFAAYELLVPARLKSTGTQLQAERAASLVGGIATGVLFAGAWDRRAQRLRRRPWRRLLG